jgi:hypothetical protein
MTKRIVVAAALLIHLALLAQPVQAACKLTAVDKQDCVFFLSWQDNSANEDGFHLERRTMPAGAYQRLKPGPAKDQIKFTDTIVEAPSATQYCYRLAAWNATGVSGWTPDTCITSDVILQAPAAASNLAVSRTP